MAKGWGTAKQTLSCSADQLMYLCARPSDDVQMWQRRSSHVGIMAINRSPRWPKVKVWEYPWWSVRDQILQVPNQNVRFENLLQPNEVRPVCRGIVMAAGGWPDQRTALHTRTKMKRVGSEAHSTLWYNPSGKGFARHY